MPFRASSTGKHRLAAGICRRKCLPVRQRIGTALTRRGVAADGDPDRLHHLLRRQSHQPAGADHGRHAGDGRVVDAVAEIVEDVGDLAEHFVGQHGRGDEIAAAARGQLGGRQQGRDRVAGVARAMGEADKGVVEIEIADHDAIGEHGQIRARLDAADEHRRGLLRADVTRKLDRDPARRRVIAAKSATDRVKNGAPGEPNDIFGKVLVSEVRRIAGQRLGQNLAAAVLHLVLCDRR